MDPNSPNHPGPGYYGPPEQSAEGQNPSTQYQAYQPPPQDSQASQQQHQFAPPPTGQNSNQYQAYRPQEPEASQQQSQFAPPPVAQNQNQYQAYKPPPTEAHARQQQPQFVPPATSHNEQHGQQPQFAAPTSHHEQYQQQPQFAPPTGQNEPQQQTQFAPPSTQDEQQQHQLQYAPSTSQNEQHEQQPQFAPPPINHGEQPQQQPQFAAPPPTQNEVQQQTQHYPPPPPPGHQGLYHPPQPTDQQAATEQPPSYVPAEHAQPSYYPPEKPGAADTAGAAAATLEVAPTLPLRPGTPSRPGTGDYQPPPPPRRNLQTFGDDDPSSPIHYARDPHKLIAYLVPFPKPQLKGVDPAKIPERFLIYTPPPPPLSKPKEGEKENKFHKVQRKWQEEVREAKTSQAKTASWKGIKGKATKGIDWAMSKTTTANLDFINRIEHDPKKKPSSHSDDEVEEGDTTKKTVGLEEMVLVYPNSVPGTQEELRAEFVNSMLRSKSKAQRDSVIATGLLPVGFAIDVLATLVWPFGGLAEIDAVWLFASLRGAKTARTTTKRLTSSAASGDNEKATLRLTFTPSQRLDLLRSYLATRCHEQDRKIFPTAGTTPTETQVLEAIGWAPAQTGGETKNWEDEQWELQEVKDDLKQVMSKGGREWLKWSKAFEKNPEKALKK